jgi:hypothetical protein
VCCPESLHLHYRKIRVETVEFFLSRKYFSFPPEFFKHYELFEQPDTRTTPSVYIEICCLRVSAQLSSSCLNPFEKSHKIFLWFNSVLKHHEGIWKKQIQTMQYIYSWHEMMSPGVEPKIVPLIVICVNIVLV